MPPNEAIGNRAPAPGESGEGFFSAIADTFMDGRAYDSALGATKQMMWKTLGFLPGMEDPAQSEPYFGNQEAYDGGRGVGSWGSIGLHAAMLVHGAIATAASFAGFASAMKGASGGAVELSGGLGAVALESGVVIVVDAAIPLVIDGAIYIAGAFGVVEGIAGLHSCMEGSGSTGGSGPAPEGAQAAFDAAQEAWSKLSRETRSMMHGVNNGTRPLSDFTSLPADQQRAILDYYRTTGANASKANAEAVRQLNQHRIDYLNGLRPDPPGGIGNFPKPGGN